MPVANSRKSGGTSRLLAVGGVDLGERRFDMDMPLLVAALCLLGLGIVMVTSSSMEVAAGQLGNPLFYMVRQLIYLAIGVAALLVVLSIPVNLWQQFRFPLLFVGFGLLIAVLIPGIGREVNGSWRWIAVGPRTQTLPLVYIDDVVDALLLAAEAPDAVGRVLHVVDPEPVTQAEYLACCSRHPGRPGLLRIPAGAFAALGLAVELMGRALRRELPLSRYRVHSLRPLANVDSSTARQVLGWSPRVGVARGLHATFGDA